MTLHTTAGDVEIELWSKEAPLACRNFVQLCMEGYYNATHFHRLVKGSFFKFNYFLEEFLNPIRKEIISIPRILWNFSGFFSITLFSVFLIEIFQRPIYEKHSIQWLCSSFDLEMLFLFFNCMFHFNKFRLHSAGRRSNWNGPWWRQHLWKTIQGNFHIFVFLKYDSFSWRNPPATEIQPPRSRWDGEFSQQRQRQSVLLHSQRPGGWVEWKAHSVRKGTAKKLFF